MMAFARLENVDLDHRNTAMSAQYTLGWSESVHRESYLNVHFPRSLPLSLPPFPRLVRGLIAQQRPACSRKTVAPSHFRPMPTGTVAEKAAARWC